jgi:heme/copper-type cytochrome/quinol oxidase subunit 2
MEVILLVVVGLAVAFYLIYREHNKHKEEAEVKESDKVEALQTAPYKVPEPAATTPIPLVVETVAPVKAKSPAKPKAPAKAPAATKAKAPAKPRAPKAKPTVA